MTGAVLRVEPLIATLRAGTGHSPPQSSGPVAQLAERCHGMAEVVGSNPIGSTSQTAPKLQHSLWAADGARENLNVPPGS